MQQHRLLVHLEDVVVPCPRHVQRRLSPRQGDCGVQLLRVAHGDDAVLASVHDAHGRVHQRHVLDARAEDRVQHFLQGPGARLRVPADAGGQRRDEDGAARVAVCPAGQVDRGRGARGPAHQEDLTLGDAHVVHGVLVHRLDGAVHVALAGRAVRGAPEADVVVRQNVAVELVGQVLHQ